MDEAEQKAIADLLRTIRIGFVVITIIMSGYAGNEMMDVI